MNAKGGIFIVLGVFLAIFTFTVSQMILPFPYGLIGGGIGSIVVIIIFTIIATRVKEEKSTQRIIQYIKCQKCNSEIPVGNNFCIKCGEKI